jgi:hypothetical protein
MLFLLHCCYHHAELKDCQYLLGDRKLSRQPQQVSTGSNSLELGTLPCNAQQDAFL